MMTKKVGRPRRVFEEEDSLSSPKSKGDRLKWIRNLVGFSQEQLSLKSGINITTIQSWERGRFGGLTYKGAERITNCVIQKGVFCSIEWLLSCSGSKPVLDVDFQSPQESKDGQKSELNAEETQGDQVIMRELLLFRRLNAGSIDSRVTDDAMLPHYSEGDYVAGVQYTGDSIKELIGLDCIVITKSLEKFFRNLQIGSIDACYNLVCSNLYTQKSKAIIHNQQLVSAAPVIWHRRKNRKQ